MAAGRSNLGVSASLHVSERTVESHIARITVEFGTPPSPHEHRRVLAVLHAVGALRDERAFG